MAFNFKTKSSIAEISGWSIWSHVEDKDSGELRRPHHVDLKTGMYRGRQIIEPRKS